MDRPVSESQEPLQGQSPRPPGTAPTLALMLALCAPLAGYACWLLDRHGPAASLSGLTALELLGAGGLLSLPFVALRLLGVNWHPDR